MAELLALAAAALFAWNGMTTQFPAEYWDLLNGEYTQLSLSHALHLETRLEKGRNPKNIGLAYHPGVPFYLASWLAMRIGAMDYPAGEDMLAYTVERPEAFWAARQKMAAAVAISGLLLLWLFLRPYGLAPACVGLALYFRFNLSWFIGLTELSNETFALPFMALFFMVLRYLLGRQKLDHGGAFLLGAIAGAGYSIKLPYGIVFFAGLAALVVFHWRAKRAPDSPAPLKHLMAYLLGAAAVIFLIMPVMIGFGNFWTLMGNHIRVITHSGYYGAGHLGPPDTGILQSNLGEIYGVYPDAFFVIGLFLAVGAAYLALRPPADSGDMAMALGLGLSVFTLLFSVIKHYQAHYVMMVAACAALAGGFLLHVIIKHGKANIRGYALDGTALVLLVALGFSGYQGASISREGFAGRITNAKADLKIVKAKPLGAKDLITWVHGAGGKPMIIIETLDWAGLLMDPRFDAIRRGLLENREISTLSGLYLRDKSMDYQIRYIISPKLYFKPRGNLALQGPMCLPYEKDDMITPLSTVVIIEKARPVPAAVYLDLSRCP